MSENAERPVALITGAGSGIGRATAVLLAEAGYSLALVGRRRNRLEETGQALPDHGGEWAALPADVGDAGAAKAMVGEALERFGRVDALINNAGMAPLEPIEAHTIDLIRRTYEVNAIGPAVITATLWPHLKAQGGGCIVNVSTLGTKDPFPGFFAYAASKAAVNLMARSCANEGREIGVRAFSVAPGAVETETLRNILSEDQVPADACMTPDDVAKVIVGCVLGEYDDRNGETIFLSAGSDAPG